MSFRPEELWHLTFTRVHAGACEYAWRQGSAYAPGHSAALGVLRVRHCGAPAEVARELGTSGRRADHIVHIRLFIKQ